MTAHALVYGGAGALGRALVGQFRKSQWVVTSIDFTPNVDATHNVILDISTASDLEKSGLDVEKKVLDVWKGADAPKLDTVVNAAGGWAGGNLADEAIYKNVATMLGQSVNSSVIAARLAGKHLKEGGLVTLVGAAAALDGTPGMIAYGLAKASTHHLVKSLAGSGSGLPTGAKAVAILPVTLDTPMNRKFMPDADHSSWTPLDAVAKRVYGWAAGEETPDNGGLYVVTTKGGKTTFENKA
ncbi:uncharacterized protein EV422DRAFT_147137 [Fimicolochytrium jonesii]|uniref:uncharacterized protein n=1 Tax=Fimicolochytrium jonesii TaxID=1396493 RepID=UPI0022FDF5F2|nr:uncharacterized protein EV422DRAFT_147137 [Fimicolochytrium jonesii]KAI8825950.1 hypothetical protein EV422DRAFT_147137 [Fimicolochytrium jonesii]